MIWAVYGYFGIALFVLAEMIGTLRKTTYISPNEVWQLRLGATVVALFWPIVVLAFLFSESDDETS